MVEMRDKSELIKLNIIIIHAPVVTVCVQSNTFCVFVYCEYQDEDPLSYLLENFPDPHLAFSSRGSP